MFVTSVYFVSPSEVNKELFPDKSIPRHSEFSEGPVGDKAQLERGMTGVLPYGLSQRVLKKNLHLNAPLHPNNSSTSPKNKIYTYYVHLSLCSSAVLFIHAAVKGTHLAAFHPQT